MSYFKKSNRLSNVRYEIRGSIANKVNEMEKEGLNILKLNIGNLAPFGIFAADHLLNEMRDKLDMAQGYSNSKGILPARQAIYEHYSSAGFNELDVEDIYIGNGASELIIMCMQGLLNDGDEILVPMPDYPLWTAAIHLSGGKAVHYICDEKAEWNPDIYDIKRKITSRTRGIVIINPNNPTGALYPTSLLSEIVEIARQNKLMIFSDEIYEKLVMDGNKFTSIATLAPDLFVATLSGLSKSHCVTGFRVGWVVFSGNKKNARDYIDGIQVLSSMRLCSNVPSQYIIETSLQDNENMNKLLSSGGRIYEQREFVYKALNEIPGVSCVKPKAAIYAFPKLDTNKFNITSDEKFAMDLLEKEHMLVVQGTGFNYNKPDHFRIVYLPDTNTLDDAMKRLGRFLSGYRQ